tara:strand:- start:80 stop:361 length:282 start_codon:yes stop_codon:yes gene_type:complete
MDVDKAKKTLMDIMELMEDEGDFLSLNWNNFKENKERKNTFQVTAEKISLDALVKLLDHPKIRNVFFHPSVAPPGIGVDGIALRYRIYFEFKV